MKYIITQYINFYEIILCVYEIHYYETQYYKIHLTNTLLQKIHYYRNILHKSISQILLNINKLLITQKIESIQHYFVITKPTIIKHFPNTLLPFIKGGIIKTFLDRKVVSKQDNNILLIVKNFKLHKLPQIPTLAQIIKSEPKHKREIKQRIMHQ